MPCLFGDSKEGQAPLSCIDKARLLTSVLGSDAKLDVSAGNNAMDEECTSRVVTSPVDDIGAVICMQIGESNKISPETTGDHLLETVYEVSAIMNA